jgi:hypothetical protein
VRKYLRMEQVQESKYERAPQATKLTAFHEAIVAAYYNNLGNIARCPITGWDDCLTTPGDLNPGPFINLLAGYWFNSNQSLPFAPPDAWGFDMGGHQYGAQGGFNGNAGAFAWAVMDGDVALVPGGEGPPALIPEPGTIALLGLGMLGLSFVARRSKRWYKSYYLRDSSALAASIAVLTSRASSGGGNTASIPRDLSHSSRHHPLVW